MEYKQAVAIRIKELMQERGFNEETLAWATQLMPSQIKKTVNCEYQSIKLDRIFVICRAFKISLFEFFQAPVFDEVEC